MEVMFIVLPVALMLAGAFLFAFLMSARSGQFDDLDTPQTRMLVEDDR